MFSKILVQAIVLYFNLMFLFCCFGNDVYMNYKTKIINSKINVHTDTTEYDICLATRVQLVFVCNRIFIYLRHVYKEYKNTLYVNYKAVSITNNPVCDNVKVNSPQQYGFIEETVDQIALTCYAQGPVNESPDMNPEDYQFYKKIVVYPYQNTNMMIFEKIEDKNEYNLIHWIKYFNWRKATKMNNIFQVPVPVQKDLPVDVNKISSNEGNILLSSKYTRLQRICTLLYGPYSNNFQVHTNADNFRYRVQYQIVLFPNGKTIIAPTYPCVGFLTNKYPPVTTKKYQLMPGVEKHDVILVTYDDKTDILKAKKLIANLYKEYLDFVFPRHILSNLPNE